jgi:hypothetical protein
MHSLLSVSLAMVWSALAWAADSTERTYADPACSARDANPERCVLKDGNPHRVVAGTRGAAATESRGVSAAPAGSATNAASAAAGSGQVSPSAAGGKK